ncbi:anti-sigma factor antagonist [Hoyosella sp. G463]|uniref:Anti-sigma factor antagonist n=1 Tax=Lolliginicoccus lacisalsi TaxID=2742202 RepID=A0A927PN15_9ACTN|nr:STAS domain-containing protein [Lolliginicoccus lacisalsi]MBD8507111.1 anti-sigma factor antagonist [Lolliginicoccus lacisalsi]
MITFVGDVDAVRIGEPRAWASRHAPWICPPHCVIDLTQATFVASAGIAAVIALAADLRERGGYCVVVADRPLRHILRVTGADKRVTVTSTLHDAQQCIARFVEAGRIGALLDATERARCRRPEPRP